MKIFVHCPSHTKTKTKTVKTGKHDTISVRSYRKYSKELLLERLRKKDLPNYSTFNCIDAAYIDWMTAVQEIVNEVAPMKIFG